MGNRFVSGSKAFGFCDVCGQRYDLPKLKPLVIKTKVTNILACPTCWDPDHPQLQLGMYPVDDPQALRNPRPDVAQAESRDIQWGWAPVGGARADDSGLTPNDLVAEGGVGTVTVTV